MKKDRLEATQATESAGGSDDSTPTHTAAETVETQSTRPLHKAAQKKALSTGGLGSAFDFAIDVVRRTLLAEMDSQNEGHVYNVVLDIPQLLSVLATLLQSKEMRSAPNAAPLQKMDEEKVAPGAETGLIIRKSVFGGSRLSSFWIQAALNQWEMVLASVPDLDYRRARRLLLHRLRSHTYSLGAWNLLSEQSIEVDLLAGTSDDDCEAESVQLSKWLSTVVCVAPTVPPVFFASSPSTLKMRFFFAKRTAHVCVASALKLPLDPNFIYAGTSVHEFHGFSGRRHLVQKQIPYVHVKGGSIRGTRLGLDAAKKWGIYKLPSLAKAPAAVFLIANDAADTDRASYRAVVGALTLKNLVKWVSELRREGGGTLAPAVVALPAGSIFPEQPLDLSAGLKVAGLKGLWDTAASLGELCPKGRLGSWLSTSVLNLAQIPDGADGNSVITSSSSSKLRKHRGAWFWSRRSATMSESETDDDDVFVVRSTAFLLLWDLERDLPLCLARLGRPTKGGWPLPTSAPRDESASSDDDADIASDYLDPDLVSPIKPFSRCTCSIS